MNIQRSTSISGKIVVALFLMLSTAGHAQFPSAIVQATNAADADELSKYFNSKIELVLPEKTGVCSDAQAKLVLNEFFKKNPVTSFRVIHQGIRESSSFAIGKYQSGSTNYRFYFLTKNKDSKTYIHQLRIERQDD
ncbi:DUF4783 domain-containing protein [Saccharicrinis fermentans]|uniref:DUF4783 domain-containing protein n=1 Tax=Saccharicrinis fermentans DSM 9555 = JCM 21142 TaxID=869213 RepID=W7XU09_9BACT|nr:DUF4783 domain-containing protein [Saccharicrinis fermentans]GAF01500.1 hypothetical protein JCM21142_108 [Saccharicrinis fermentans DSM 9555 = JCM 21142]